MTRLFRSKSARPTTTNSNSFFFASPPSPSLYLTNDDDDEDDDGEEEDYDYEYEEIEQGSSQFHDAYFGNGSNRIRTFFISPDQRRQQAQSAGGNNNNNNNNFPPLMQILVAALRKSIVTCSVDTEEDVASTASSSMDIGCPTDVKHVFHVTFDRFNGFLGLPAELVPEVPRKVPSARTPEYNAKEITVGCDVAPETIPFLLGIELFTDSPTHVKGKGFGHIKDDTPVDFPSWLSKEDVEYYANKFEQTGFTGEVNYYRACDLTWELNAPWGGAKVNALTKFITGDLDLVYHIQGIKEYLKNGEFQKDVPLMEDVVIMKWVVHFINQEKSDEINTHIMDFLNKF